MQELFARLRAGDQRALARAISVVERGGEAQHALMQAAHAAAGRAHVCGVTGAPGVGKSTLVQRLAIHYRDRGRRVAIVAVDPSSSITGGALLGDRIRMGAAVDGGGVFMRSVATRGHLGGLSRTTRDIVTLIDAAGFDLVFLETVGTGQSEIEIVQQAHTTLVVLVPGLGDSIQAMKAGILEIADVFVVNKADREGAQHVAADLATIRELDRPGASAGTWSPPIALTVSTSGDGIAPLGDWVDAHREFLVASGRRETLWKDAARRALHEHLSSAALEHVLREAEQRGLLSEAIDSVAARATDPRSAALKILHECLDSASPQRRSNVPRD